MAERIVSLTIYNMEKKALFINGSARRDRGITYRLSTKVREGLESEGYEVEYIHLVDLNINFCEGCVSEDGSLCNPERCLEGKLNDDFKIVMDKMLKRDIIVFLSPVYWYSMSGRMKNLIERLTSLENVGKMLDGKIGGFVVTAQEDGAMMTILQLMGTLNDMGFLFPPYAFTYSVNFLDPLQDKEAVEYALRLGKNLAKMHRLVKGNKWV